MNFKSLSVAGKIMAVIGVLGIAMSIMAVTGFIGLQSVAAASKEIAISSEEIRLAGRMNQDALALSRNEFQIAADPTSLNGIRSVTQRNREAFRDRLEQLQETAGDQQEAMLRRIGDRYESYIAELEGTFEVAETVNVELNVEQQAILSAVESSMPQLQALRDAITEYVDFTNAKGADLQSTAITTSGVSRTLLIAFSLIGIIGGMVLARFISQRQISIPLKHVAQGLKSVASGDLDVSIQYADRKDEIGDLNRALAQFIESAKTQLETIAQQERDARRKLDRANAVKKLTDDFQVTIADVVASLASATEEMQATASSMASTAEETSAQTQSVSSVTVQTSANVQTVAAATEELAAAIAEVSGQMTRGTNIAKQANTKTELAITTLSSLTDAAAQIDDILALITEITAQTKLLALNATIEAMRAGEAGRGFNVVAQEVKALATQTEQAAGTVTEQVKSIQAATNAVVKAVREIDEVVDEVNQVTSSVAASTEQQVSSTNEITRSIQEAAAGTEQVSSSISMLESASQTTAASSTQVAGTASELSRRSQQIRMTIDEYLAAVEAA